MIAESLNLPEEMQKLIEKWNYENSNTKLTSKYESVVADNLSVSQHMMVKFIYYYYSIKYLLFLVNIFFYLIGDTFK